MDTDKLPIKFFAPREIDELRIEGNGNSEKPKWVLEGDALVKRAGRPYGTCNSRRGRRENRSDVKCLCGFL